MRKSDDILIQQFIAAFSRFDEMDTYVGQMPPIELRSTNVNPLGFPLWQPAAIETSRDALSIFQKQFPTGLPRLYEKLILSYRWLEVDLDVVRLLANPPAPDLKPLHDRMFQDPVLDNTLIPARFVRFGISLECYDPICFDLNHYRDGDCPIGEVEHESILCHDKIGDSQQIFQSFRELVEAVVAS